MTEAAELWSVSDVCEANPRLPPSSNLISNSNPHAPAVLPTPPTAPHYLTFQRYQHHDHHTAHPIPLRPWSLSTRGGGGQWLGRTNLPDPRKASMEPLSKKSRWSNVSLRNHHSGSRSPSPSKCETKRRGEPFSLASNGTGVALAVPRNLASPSQHVVCCRSFPRVSTTYLPRLATAVLLCCGIEKTLCEARCKRRYPPPTMVVSAATDRATVRCLRRTGYHNGDTTLARHRVPSLSVDRLAEADCPHGRRLAFPLDESPWAVPGTRGGGVPACHQNHHVEVGVVVYRSRCNILPLRGQRDGDRFPTSSLHSISRRPRPRLPPCSL